MHSKIIWLTRPEVTVRFMALWDREQHSPTLDDTVKDWKDLLRRLEEKGHLILKYHKSGVIFSKLTDPGYEFASNLIPYEYPLDMDCDR